MPPNARRPGVSLASRARGVVGLLSYTPDWLLTVVLASAFFALDYVEGFRRVFSLTDTSLLHPMTLQERVPDWALYLIAGLSPFVLQVVINLVTIRSWWDFHNSSLGLLLSLALSGSITQFVKITVGRPRPDIISRCIPKFGATDPPLGLSDWHICTQTNNLILRDGFRSFPSGHSSLSFAGLGFLAFYLAGKLHLFDHRGHTGKAWLSLAPFSGAALVAISRTMDYRHHWQDVLVGSLLGTAMAYFSYRQYYPALASPLSHLPYSPRADSVDSHDPAAQPLRAGTDGRGVHSPLPYRDGSDERQEAEPDHDGMGSTVPRQGAQDLPATWQDGRAKPADDVEAGRRRVR